MNQIIRFQAYQRRQRFLLILPLLIAPFITLVFWLLGGGTGVQPAVAGRKGGFNTRLPGALAKEDAADKMSFYAVAAREAARRSEQLRMDPYRKDSTIEGGALSPSQIVAAKPFDRSTPDQSIYDRKVAAIQRQLSISPKKEEERMDRPTLPIGKLQSVNNFIPDPEIESINATLDKLLAIQQSNKSVVKTDNEKGLTVLPATENEATYFGKSPSTIMKPSFYSDEIKAVLHVTAIPAVLASTQAVQNGTVVKLELNVPVVIKGIRLPAGATVYGVATIEGERLRIHIPSIRYGDQLLHVSLSVYDLDGLEGICTPGSQECEVLKQSADNAIQSNGFAGLDFSLKTQAAATGISAAKNLLCKKVKQVRVTVAAGYRVLLQDHHAL
ncbi:Bacteroides conjugative transposon TraM protein [Hydrobacter penzbergensis]|uniref:Bacteroides conjugative transposon TraM protein n=1 Tax=Hydrobacter penzbergensis TaxID=1235997 RepID=A0A8X8IGE3_9BACT|nr:conjugative transposon protein TraM [Hydrobacter penzbergensis]SDX02659.1 Bacteroides conjugative transposon TraM protein [Hydrobacter penzbergensis]